MSRFFFVAQHFPDAPCMDYLPTWKVKNGHMNNGKWLAKYSHPIEHLGNNWKVDVVDVVDVDVDVVVVVVVVVSLTSWLPQRCHMLCCTWFGGITIGSWSFWWLTSVLESSICWLHVTFCQKHGTERSWAQYFESMLPQQVEVELCFDPATGHYRFFHSFLQSKPRELLGADHDWTVPAGVVFHAAPFRARLWTSRILVIFFGERNFRHVRKVLFHFNWCSTSFADLSWDQNFKLALHYVTCLYSFAL